MDSTSSPKRDSGNSHREALDPAASLVKLLPGQGGKAGFMQKQKAEAWSLVLLSANITHRMIQSHNGWEILVSKNDAVAARYNLEQYETENSQWPPVINLQQNTKPKLSKWTFLFCLLLVGFFAITGDWSEGSKWFKYGAIQTAALKEHHELWRLVTALTLHADIVHLFGNICLGGILIAFLSGLTGSGTAWLLTILAGSFGNLLNILFHGGNHNSIGFSTAVFGVIGTFCGIRALRDGVVNVLLPLGAGFGLLAMLGAGGERTDVGAHVWGMISGMGLGAVCYYLDPEQRFSHDKRLQNSLSILVLLGVVFCWGLALS